MLFAIAVTYHIIHKYTTFSLSYDRLKVVSTFDHYMIEEFEYGSSGISSDVTIMQESIVHP